MGNRKKAFLITAFALKPELLLLDEPVNGLDFSGTEFLYEQIKGYGAYGTLLFSSHVLESVTLTADRVLVMEEGRISRSVSREEMDGEGGIDFNTLCAHRKSSDNQRLSAIFPTL